MDWTPHTRQTDWVLKWVLEREREKERKRERKRERERDRELAEKQVSKIIICFVVGECGPFFGVVLVRPTFSIMRYNVIHGVKG